MEELLSKIVSDTFTTDQLRRRLRATRSFLDNHFFEEQKKTADQFFTEPTDLAWYQNHAQDLGTLSSTNIDEVFEKLEKLVADLPSVTCITAVSITEEAQARIAAKAREGKSTLFEFRTDPNIIAGAAFIISGVYKDYSVKKTLSDHRHLLHQVILGGGTSA